MKPSTILSGASSVLSKFQGITGPWGIAAGLGSALLGVGAELLDNPSDAPHVERVRAAAPVVAAALARAEAEKARLAAGGDPRG